MGERGGEGDIKRFKMPHVQVLTSYSECIHYMSQPRAKTVVIVIIRKGESKDRGREMDGEQKGTKKNKDTLDTCT